MGAASNTTKSVGRTTLVGEGEVLHRSTLARGSDAYNDVVELEAHKMVTPIKLCVICQRVEEACERDGPHIFDCITYSWAVVDEEHQQPYSFHISEREAKLAASRYNATS
jgi:hypothetical protein